MKTCRLLPAFVLLASPAFSAGSEPVALGEDGPWIAIPVGAGVDLGSLSEEAIAALANLDGDPTVTTAEESAMIAVLMQVLGINPRQPAYRPD